MAAMNQNRSLLSSLFFRKSNFTSYKQGVWKLKEKLTLSINRLKLPVYGAIVIEELL